MRSLTQLTDRLTPPQLQFVSYLLVGGWNTVFGMAVYAGLYHWLGGRVHYLLLLIPANVLAITNAYICYKLFVFRTRGNVLREYFRCYVVYGGMMLAGSAALFLLVEWLRVPPVAANCVCVAFTTVVSYAAHRGFSFRQDDRTVDAPASGRTRTYAGLVFYLALAAVFSLHVASMLVIPLPWLDEVHIVEMGRVALAQGLLKASFVMNADGTSYAPFYYVGPVVQELSYRLLGVSGPRVSAMLGLIVAAWFCRLWLLRKGTSPWRATGLAVLVLTHPLLVQSVRLVRIDSWAFAIFFVVVHALACRTEKTTGALQRRMFVLGLLSGLSLFVWPTTLVFNLFYLKELFDLRAERKLTVGYTTRLFLSAALGACCMGALLALPFLGNTGAITDGLGAYFSGQGVVTRWSALAATGRGILVCLAKESLRDPFFAVAVLIGLAGGVRKPVLSGSFALALLLCMASGFHTFRYIYLFPFLFVFAATGMEQLGRRSTYWGRGLLVCILVHGTLTAVLSYAGMSLVYKGRSATALTDALRDVVGPGAKRVYSRTLQDYYAGRDLGWEHYRYAADPLVTDDELHAGLLARVDYVIDPVTRPYYAIEESFTLYGVIRDRLIRAARGASEDDRQDEPSVPPRFPRIHNYCVQLGRTLALAAAAADEQRAFDQKLAALGFRRTQTVNLTVPASAYTPFARWVLSIQATNPDYDKLVIWRRTKPGDGPSDDTQTR